MLTASISSSMWAAHETQHTERASLLTELSVSLCSGQESDLARLHNDAIKNDPFISAALGPNPKVRPQDAHCSVRQATLGQ